jgi:hypothetical protein
MIYIY